MNINPYDEQLRAYVGMVAGRLNQEAPWNQEVGAYQLCTKDWSVLATKMYSYFFITRDDYATTDDLDAYVKTCVSWALNNYKGLPRGLQKGLAIYPVLLQSSVSAEVMGHVKKKSPTSHFAAFELPTVVNLSTGSMTYLDSTPIWGFAMWKSIKELANKTLRYT